MALSMDEQRILHEIEQHLVHDDPSLAQRLTTFERRRWLRHAAAGHDGEPSTLRHRLRIAALVVVGLCVAGIVAAILAAVLNPSVPASSGRAAPAFVTTPVNHVPHGQQIPVAGH